MAWFEDLSPCSYFGDQLLPALRAVGWLERGKPFLTGPVDPAVFTKLIDLAKNPWAPIVTCGLHDCDLCLYRPEASGSHNLFIPGNGIIYVCPEVIVHYLNAHHYAPPVEFRNAVMSCPPMHSVEYLRAILASGGEPLRNLIRRQ